MTLRAIDPASAGGGLGGEPVAGSPVIPPAPESFADVDVYLRRRLENFEFDLEPEVAQSIGGPAVLRSAVRVALLRDLIAWLAPAVEAEAADRQRAVSEDSADEAAKRWAELRAEGLNETELRLLDGDR